MITALAMSSAVEEHRPACSSTPRRTSPSTGQQKSPGSSSGSSGSRSPVSASTLPPSELFPVDGLLEELLHQEAELWRRNELLMQSLRRKPVCLCVCVSVSWFALLCVQCQWSVCILHKHHMTTLFPHEYVIAPLPPPPLPYYIGQDLASVPNVFFFLFILCSCEWKFS